MRPGRGWHLGVRRARLIAEHTAQVQQMRDLLECAWPAVLDAARQPLKSTTWHAALTVALARAADGDLSRVTGLERGGSMPRCAARSPAGTPSTRGRRSSTACSPRAPTRPGDRDAPRRAGTRRAAAR